MSASALEERCSSSLMLAPMVGITHYVVRRAIQEYLPGEITALWPTEMLSSWRLPHQSMGETPELIFEDRAAGLIPQLLGNDEASIQKSIQKLEAWGASAIDINMGCPVQKALRHNYGVALMGDPSYAKEVTAMAVRSTKMPVSVKLRAGMQKDLDFLISFCRGLEEAGAAWITLHPRTAAEKRRGSADWSQVKEVKRVLGIPVIGNGDIQTSQDVFRMFEETGCDKVMAGRILTSKPWILREVHGAPKLSSEEEAMEYGRFLKRVIELSKEFYELAAGMKRINFLVYHGHGWLEFGHFLWTNLRKSKSYEEMESVVESFFSTPKKMFERTELRY